MHKHLPLYRNSLIKHARRLRKEMTIAEAKIWSRLRNNLLGAKVRRQVPIGKYILDFYCVKARLCIEIDGSQHYAEEGLRKDEIRDKYLNSEGIEVLRFTDYEVLKNTVGVLDAIFEKIQQRLESEIPPQSSSKRGGGFEHPLLLGEDYRRGLKHTRLHC